MPSRYFLGLTVSAALLCGCANPLATAYVNQCPPELRARLRPELSAPGLRRAQDIYAESAALKESGHVIIGEAVVTRDVTYDQMAQHGMKVGAAVVLYKVASSATPGLFPIVSMSGGKVSETRFTGDIGGQPIYGSATTTAPDRIHVDHVPYTKVTTMVHAIFWAKLNEQ